MTLVQTAPMQPHAPTKHNELESFGVAYLETWSSRRKPCLQKQSINDNVENNKNDYEVKEDPKG